jgi:hypothetical protein
MNNNFLTAEEIGRQIFRQLLIQQGVKISAPAKKDFDSLDYYYENSKGKKVGVEIKCRNPKYENYPTHLMEYKKFTAILLKLVQKQIDEAYYCCIFGDWIYMYNIRNIACYLNNGQCRVSSGTFNKTTVVDKGQTQKLMLNLQTDWAIVFHKEDGLWIKSEASVA